MSHNRKPLDFIVGDLVYFVGYEGPSDRNKVGVVVKIKIGDSHFPLYEVHWIKEHITSAHTAAHIDLLYTCLLYTSPSPRDATLSRMPSSA